MHPQPGEQPDLVVTPAVRAFAALDFDNPPSTQCPACGGVLRMVGIVHDEACSYVAAKRAVAALNPESQPVIDHLDGEILAWLAFLIETNGGGMPARHLLAAAWRGNPRPSVLPADQGDYNRCVALIESCPSPLVAQAMKARLSS